MLCPIHHEYTINYMYNSNKLTDSNCLAEDNTSRVTTGGNQLERDTASWQTTWSPSAMWYAKVLHNAVFVCGKSAENCDNSSLLFPWMLSWWQTENTEKSQLVTMSQDRQSRFAEGHSLILKREYLYTHTFDSFSPLLPSTSTVGCQICLGAGSRRWPTSEIF